jgi:hypothetical protein
MGRPLVIACGALVSELRTALEAGGIADAVEVRYLPANLHNRPEAIEPAVRTMLDELDPDSTRPVLLGYADCGSGGALDRLLAERPHVHRMPGAHCYEFFAGSRLFAELHDAEPGTFYLTDFLAKHFDALVWQGLGLDRHPELRDMYFGNYTRVLLLTQAAAHTDVVDAGRRAAEQLGLRFEHLHVGLDQFSIAFGKVA